MIFFITRVVRIGCTVKILTGKELKKILNYATNAPMSTLYHDSVFLHAPPTEITHET